MRENTSRSDELAELRKRAEGELRSEPVDLGELSAEDTQRLIHDLQVHKIELEMQNEELRRIQQELEDSRNKYSNLYDFAPVGYFTVGENGLILEANLSGASLLRTERSFLIGKPLSRFVARDDIDMFYLHHKEVFAARSREICEVRMLRKDDTEFYAQLESLAIQDYEGNSGQCRTVVSDISERKQMEEELLRAQKLESLGILAGGIAHDFNNILTAILGNISLAKAYKDPGKTHEKLAEAEKACIRAKGLTHQLLTFSDGGAPVKKTASIVELLEDSANFALSGSKVACVFSIQDDLWPVEVDQEQITQVVNNIVINADQAMPKGGIVRIYAGNVFVEAEYGLPLQPGAYIKVSIEDRGIGIAEKNLHSIFDPYFTTKQKGSGLGLATSYSIIKNHGGHIIAESQLGFGTSFHIYLPAFPGRIPVKEREEREELITGQGKVLVMDDEEMVREIARGMLTHMGYRVTVAADGAEAIELHKAARESGDGFDAVIMDLTVPGGMGGRKAIQKLLKIDPEVKAVVSSGYSNDPIMADFKKYGFEGVITKPYDIAQLSDILHRITKGLSGSQNFDQD